MSKLCYFSISNINLYNKHLIELIASYLRILFTYFLFWIIFSHIFCLIIGKSSSLYNFVADLSNNTPLPLSPPTKYRHNRAKSVL